jgi:phosphatidylserine/phosphatidylglycerophosphate/cardiolipin synthase-like enzyme
MVQLANVAHQRHAQAPLSCGRNDRTHTGKIPARVICLIPFRFNLVRIDAAPDRSSKENRMRTTATGTMFKASAYAGTYVTVLAWDTRDDRPPALPDLLGFAIERAQYGAQGTVIERYWLDGIKRFSWQRALPPGTPVSTAMHPVQGFQWADYTAKPGIHYQYRIVPASGAPKNITLHHDDAVVLDVTTESEHGTGAGQIRHDVFFNRGVIGSQAYARQFGNRTPDATRPGSPEMRWLSRGLFEALVEFIGLAGDGMALRAAFYEFHYQPVANALASAIEAGADVRIVYDAESSYAPANLATLRAARLDQGGAAIPRTVTEGIRHNKFMVLLDGDTPVAVLTGSTNISAGGIFGHSNLAHIVWDPVVAGAYLAYWQHLADGRTPAALRTLNQAATPTPDGGPPHGVTVLFSPRDGKDANDTLAWYAARMGGAKELVCATFAFNIDDTFQQVLAANNDVLRYVIKDDPLGKNESIGHDRDVIFAAGSVLPDGALGGFAAERDNPLNRNQYIHNKFMLVDPLGPDPLVITGSANFSKPSQRSNDENMLVIRGNPRVADIYFGEFMRVFDHHYTRYIVDLLSQQPGRADPGAGYLKEHAEAWVPSHFNPDSYKAKRRRYFTTSAA